MCFCHFFLFLYFYCCAEFQKKNKEIPTKVGYRRKDGLTHGRKDKHKFMGPPLQSVQNKFNIYG